MPFAYYECFQMVLNSSKINNLAIRYCGLRQTPSPQLHYKYFAKKRNLLLNGPSTQVNKTLLFPGLPHLRFHATRPQT